MKVQWKSLRFNEFVLDKLDITENDSPLDYLFFALTFFIVLLEWHI